MSKGNRGGGGGGGGGGGDKRLQFFEGIVSQKPKTVEWSLIYGGFDPFKTEDDEGNTPMQVACRGGYSQSLQVIVDYLKRQRQRAMLEQLDDDGYTPLHIAAISGHLKCVEVLLRGEAKATTKSRDGRTAAELAIANKRGPVAKFIADFLKPAVQEDDDDDDDNGDVDADGLTARQRSKLKKQALKQKAQRGVVQHGDAAADAEPETSTSATSASAGAAPAVASVPAASSSSSSSSTAATSSTSGDVQWPALASAIADGKFELKVDDEKVLDMALFRFTAVKHLEIWRVPIAEMPPQMGALVNLTFLSLQHCGLPSLPLELGECSALKTLLLNHNKLTKLPAALGKLGKLETLDLSDNALVALEPKALLYALSNLVTLRASNNEIATLDEFDADAMSLLTRLSEVVLVNNKITALGGGFVSAPALSLINLEKNQIDSLPVELSHLKKLKTLLLSGNPLDAKVKKILNQGNATVVKDLQKWLEKNGGASNKKKK